MTRAALVGGGAWPLAAGLPPSLLVMEAVVAPLNGLAAWLVWRRIDVGLERKRAGLRRWGWFILLGALWSAALNGAGRPGLAVALLGACVAAGCWTVLAFRRLQPGGAALLVPSIIWFAVTAALIAARF